MIEYLRVGIITSSFGIKGEINIKSTTNDIKRFSTLTKVYILNENEYDNLSSIFDKYLYTIENVKYGNNKVILKIKNIDSIEDATKLISKSIYIDRKDAITLKDNEYYVADIIDKNIILNNQIISKVKDVMFTGANQNLVCIYNNKEVLIPMIKDFIDYIDLENNNIYLKTVDGLIDL